MPGNPAMSQQLIEALDALSGLHPGCRPVHAKGLMCSGTFTPSPEAPKLTRAAHANRPSTPVTVRYSNAPGLPESPDNDPRSGPRGIAVRFDLADHVHTDIIAHSFDGFPVRTGEEFIEFLHAAAAFGAGRPKHSAPSSPRTRGQSGSSKRRSRSRAVLRARPISRLRRSGSPTPRA
jgi:catalase